MNVNLQRLIKVQKVLSGKLVIKDRYDKPIRQIAGVDLAFHDNIVVVACVNVHYPGLETLDEKTLTMRINFPYISGFLSFREGPPIIKIIRTFDLDPQVYLINAHGISHPLLFGCASYVGVITNKVTVGVAQSKLCGEYDLTRIGVGDWAPLVYGGIVVGAVLKSKWGYNPIFVSPGHRISLASSINVVERCMLGHKLPEPLYRAHILANAEKSRIIQR